MAGEFGQRERIDEAEKVTTFLLKVRESVLGSKHRSELFTDVQDLCTKAPLVKTKDIEINETEFEKYNNGEVIFIKTIISSGLCEQV